MQYSPKLKKAMEEMKAIYKKYDIGGFTILHTADNGHSFSEFLNVLDPSYSCIILNPNGEVRFRSKLADYNGDKAAWRRKTEDSLNLLQSVSEVGGRVVLPLMELTSKLEKDLNAENRPGGFTSHDTQNN
jgi:hypothetical protein